MRHLLPTGIILLLLAVPAVLGQQNSQAPLDLKGAIGMAIRKNPTVASAQRAADASAARISAAKSMKGFNLSARADYGYVSKDTVFFGTPVLEKNTEINRLIIEKLIYSGGRVESQINQAKGAALATNEDAIATIDVVTSNVAQAYFQALTAYESIDVAKQSVTSLDASYSAAEKLRDAGTVTKSDVLRTQVELDASKDRLLNAENLYRNAVAALKTAIGLDQNTDIKIVPDLSAFARIDPENLAPKERHYVTASRAALSAADAAVKGAKSGSRPQVFLQSDFENIAAGAEFPRRSNTVGVGLGVKIPIWDSGSTKAGIDEARALRDSAEENIRASAQASQLELQTAKQDYANAKARLETTITRVTSAEESLRVLQAGYKEGMSPVTDVLAAESALAGARFSRIATEYEVRNAWTRLIIALGHADLLQS